MIETPKDLPSDLSEYLSERAGEQLYELLHIRTALVMDMATGKWLPGKPQFMKPRYIGSHLAGSVTYGFHSSYKHRAPFLALDIDEYFDQRLPVVRDVLIRRQMDKAAFATNGSKPGKGKIVVCLSRPMLKEYAVPLIKELLEECKNDSRWWCMYLKGARLIHTPVDKTTDVRPNFGHGGILRVCGRKGKDAPIEQFLTLDGQPSVSIIYDIVPWKIQQGPRTIRRPRLIRESEGFIVRESMSYQYVRDVLVGKAFQYMRHYVENPEDGHAGYEAWFNKVREKSVSLRDEPNKSERKLLDMGPRYYSDYAQREIEKRSPRFEILSASGHPLGVVRIYTTLVRYCRYLGVSPSEITLSYEDIAEYCGISPSMAVKDINAAIKCGMLKIARRGQPRSEGQMGIPHTYALSVVYV